MRQKFWNERWGVRLGLVAAAVFLAGCANVRTLEQFDQTAAAIQEARKANAPAKAPELMRVAEQLDKQARDVYEKECRLDEAERLSLEAQEKAMMAKTEAMKPPPPPPPPPKPEPPKPAPAPMPPPNRPPGAVINGPTLGQAKQPAAFDGTASSDPDGDPLTYAWDFGNGMRSQEPKPQVTYDAEGEYTVTLVVRDPKGAAGEATHRIAIRPRARRRIVLRNVHFDFDKFDLRADSQPILNEVAEYLKEYDEVRVLVVGHTDWTGTNAYNQALSERRANSVRRYLESKGIARQRIDAVGRGESQPVATNQTREGRALNRRVEFELK